MENFCLGQKEIARVFFSAVYIFVKVKATKPMDQTIEDVIRVMSLVAATCGVY